MTVHNPGLPPIILEYLEHLVDIEMHNTLVFPESTANVCVLTAHVNANTWSAWVEIVDDQGAPVSLSSKFAVNAGHITVMNAESTNVASALFMIELAYGASKISICRFRFTSETNQIAIAQIPRVRGVEIPAGETLYYRAMCATGGKTANVYFRYFLHE